MNSVTQFRRWSLMPTLLCTFGVVVPSRAVAQRITDRPAAGPAARPALADPDVYLLPLVGRGDALEIGVPVNVSRRNGYDNQPAFERDSRALYFTSNRGDGQSDIYRHDFSTGLTAPLRATKPESEYSAMPTLDGQSITVIRVEADSTQRLAQFPTDGSAQTVLFPAIKPVGYFAQADDSTWAMFVLGSPATLRLARTGAGRGQTTGDAIAGNVGRSLHRIPGTAHVSYVQKGAAVWYVMRLDPVSRRVDTLIALPKGSEDVAWVDSTTLLVGSGTQLMQWQRGTTAWKSLGDLAVAHLVNITRLAVSPNGEWLALVAEPQSRTATPSPAATKVPVDRRRFGTSGYTRRTLLPREPSVVDSNVERIALLPDPRPGQNVFSRSDKVAFARVGIPAHSRSSFHLVTPFHSPKDEASTVKVDHIAPLISADTKAAHRLSDGPQSPRHQGGRSDALASRSLR